MWYSGSTTQISVRLKSKISTQRAVCLRGSTCYSSTNRKCLVVATVAMHTIVASQRYSFNEVVAFCSRETLVVRGAWSIIIIIILASAATKIAEQEDCSNGNRRSVAMGASSILAPLKEETRTLLTHYCLVIIILTRPTSSLDLCKRSTSMASFRSSRKLTKPARNFYQVTTIRINY